MFVTNISDHFPIFTSFTLTETNTCKSFILRQNITKSKILKLKQDLDDQNWDFVSIKSNTNDDYNKFLNLLFNKLSLYLPLENCSKLPTSNNKSWIMPEIIALPKQKSNIYKLMIQQKISINKYKSQRNKISNII